jgi:MFS family permease
LEDDAGRSGVRALLARPPLRGAPLESYRRERTWTLTLNVAYAVTAGGFVAVVADKVWAVHPAVIAAITAAPMFSNLSGVLWSRLGHGRRKIPLIAWMSAGSLVFTGAIAFAPEGTVGAWVLVLGMALANLLLAGVIALRSIVWSLNYDRAVRARVTGRLNVMTTATLLVAALSGSWLMDRDPSSFRAIYAVSALIGIVGALAIARAPVVDEEEHLAIERDEHEDAEGDGEHRGMLAVLREDPKYARYMAWQFLLGSSNMMVDAPLIYLVSNQLQAGYVVSIGLVTVVPLALATLTLPWWAHFLDRVHIVEFRARASLLWVGWQLLVFIGAWQESLAWILFGRILLGLARGGGSLAWNLGHNDFATQRNLAAYMGLHVTLTGLRGLFAPFVGMLLFVGWSERSALGITLPGFDGIGAGAFLVPVILSSVAGLGFLRLWGQIRAERF